MLIFLIIFINENKYESDSETCVTPPAITVIYTFFSFVIVILGISECYLLCFVILQFDSIKLVFAYFLRNSRDAYRIRWEKICLSIMWSVVLVASFMYVLSLLSYPLLTLMQIRLLLSVLPPLSRTSYFLADAGPAVHSVHFEFRSAFLCIQVRPVDPVQRDLR